MATIKPDNIDGYITGFPKNVQKILEQVRVIIKKAAPDAEETISYAIPTSLLNVTWSTLQLSKIISAYIQLLQELKHLKKNFLITKPEKDRFNFRLTNQCL